MGFFVVWMLWRRVRVRSVIDVGVVFVDSYILVGMISVMCVKCDF